MRACFSPRRPTFSRFDGVFRLPVKLLRIAHISRHGGQRAEMMAEWGVRGADCTTWPAAFGSDYACFGAGPVLLPAYISRGGSFSESIGAGVFAATTWMGPPSSPDFAVGLRCVR